MSVVLLYAKGHDEPQGPDDWPSKHYDLIPDGAEVLVIWRTVSDPDDPAALTRTHVYTAGAWENVTAERAAKALKKLLAL